MREFKSLKPDGVPRGFDATIETEAPIVKVEETKGKIVLTYAFPGFYLVDEDTEIKGKKMAFKRPNVEALGSFAESGRPLLPSFGRYVQIPKNCDYKVSVKKSNQAQFDNVDLYPAQTKLVDLPGVKDVFEYDSAFYEKDEIYPAEVVDVSGPFLIDDYTALLVSVRPLQYNPKKKKLIGWSNIEVTIEITQRTPSDVPTNETPTVDRKAFGNLFLNPRRSISERVLPTIVAGPVVSILPRGPEFIIIYADNPNDPTKDLKKAAQSLMSWKSMIGLTTEIVPMSTIKAIPLSPTIHNDIDKMKSYLRGRRGGLSALRYVLLLGDENTIPSEKFYVHEYLGPNEYFENRYTDYYYSTPTDWVAGTYVFPWLAIGRVTATTLQEAMDTVNKIIAYEKTPPIDSAYYEKITLAGYFQATATQNKENRRYIQTVQKGVYERLAPLGFQIDRHYVSGNPGHEDYYYDGSQIPPSVKAVFVNDQTATNGIVHDVTEGRLFCGHRDHGSFDGWYKPPFTIAQLNTINTTMPTVFYSINCLTGTFGYNPAPALKDCFSEILLRMKGGAPSLIAATDLSDTFLNDDLIEALFDATFAGVISTFPGSNASYPVKRNRLGDMLNYAKFYLPVAEPTRDIKSHFEIYHVLGDPTLEIWTEMPKLNRISAILRREMIDVNMTVCPSGSVVTFWYGGKMLKKLEPSSNRFSVSIRGLVPMPRSPFPLPILPVIVCFKAPGYRFAQTNVRLISTPTRIPP